MAADNHHPHQEQHHHHAEFGKMLKGDGFLATRPEERLAAIVDFTFNLGPGRLQTSTLRRRVNQQDWTAAGQELRRWVYGAERCCPGSSRDERLRFPY